MVRNFAELRLVDPGKQLAKPLLRSVLARPIRDQLVGGPVVVAGLFRAASGLGRAVRSCADSLEAAGIAVWRVDLSRAFGQEDLSFGGRLNPFPRHRSGTLVLHMNAPSVDKALWTLGLLRFRSWRIIGAWVWETPIAPTSWRAPGRRFSEIWAPSRFAAEAIAPVAEAPVRVAPHAVSVPASATAARHRFGLDREHFVCLTMADGRSSFFRKNPIGAVNVFRAGLEGREDARLIVKTRSLYDQPAYRRLLVDAIGGDPRIRLLDEDLREGETWALLASADVFLSMHRAEGFGLPIAEAMALGKAVIATGWSGNMDYMKEDAAIAAPFRLVPVDDPSERYENAPGVFWAEPDCAAAAQSLRRLADDENLRRRLGDSAREAIASHCNGAAYFQALQSLSERGGRA